MNLLETVGILTLVLVLSCGGVIGYNHYKFRQWQKAEWKRRNADRA